MILQILPIRQKHLTILSNNNLYIDAITFEWILLH